MRFTTHFRTCLAKFSFVGGKKSDIAFQLVLQQSRKKSFTFSACCPFYRTSLKTTELYKAVNRCNVYRPEISLKVARVDFLGGIPPKFEH